MDQISVEILLQHSDEILDVTGQDSYVDWPLFSQVNSDLLRQLGLIQKQVQQFYGVTRQYFLASMKKLKSLDIPDALKCAKSGKIPTSGLKAITHRFSIQGDKLKIYPKPSELKKEANTIMSEYVEDTNKVKEAIENANNIIKHLIEKHNFSTPKQQNPQQLIYEFQEQKVMKIASRLKMQLHNQIVLNLENYSNLLSASVDLCSEHYVEIMHDFRSKSRQSIKQPIRYYRIFSEQYNKVQKLLECAQQTLICKIGLPKDAIEKTQISLINDGKMSNLLALQAQTRQNLKQRLRSTKHVTAKQGTQIMEYQIGLLKDHNIFKEVFVCLPKTEDVGQLASALLSTMLSDYVFLHFSVQEEDYMLALSDVDPQLFGRLENAVCQLLSDIGLINGTVRGCLTEEMPR